MLEVVALVVEADHQLDVGGLTLGYTGDHVFGSRVDDLEPLTALGGREGVVDEDVGAHYSAVKVAMRFSTYAANPSLAS